MKTEIFTFCDFAQDNAGKLTIVGTFDTIIARNFPCIHPQLSVVIRIRFDIWEINTHHFRIETQDLDGEAHIDAVGGTLDIKETGNATAVTNLVFTISNLQFRSAGVINFVLYIDNKEIVSVPLYIRRGQGE